MQHFEKSVELAGKLDQKKIRDIIATHKFDTVLGPFWYDERRIFFNQPGEIGQWQNGVFEVVDKGEKKPPLQL